MREFIRDPLIHRVSYKRVCNDQANYKERQLQTNSQLQEFSYIYVGSQERPICLN